MELNCEGAEYEIINSMFEADIIKDIPEIMIQFHLMKGHTYKETVKKLKKTHSQYIYPFTGNWEMWSIK